MLLVSNTPLMSLLFHLMIKFDKSLNKIYLYWNVITCVKLLKEPYTFWADFFPQIWRFALGVCERTPLYWVLEVKHPKLVSVIIIILSILFCHPPTPSKRNNKFKRVIPQLPYSCLVGWSVLKISWSKLLRFLSHCPFGTHDRHQA